MNNPSYDQFLDVLATGDEAQTVAFLEAHLKELPEDLQEKIVFALFEDSVGKQLEEQEALASAQKEGLDILAKLQAAKKMYEEAQQAQALKESLGA